MLNVSPDSTLPESHMSPTFLSMSFFVAGYDDLISFLQMSLSLCLKSQENLGLLTSRPRGLVAYSHLKPYGEKMFSELILFLRTPKATSNKDCFPSKP